MAPLPSSNTFRIRAHYTGPFGSHTMTFRFANGTTPAASLAVVQDVAQALATLQYESTVWDSADYAVEGSDVFNPLPGWTPIVPGVAGAPDLNDDPGRFLNFVGRSSDGRKIRLYLFEERYKTRNDMRYPAGAIPAITAALAELASHPELVTIGGLPIVWKSYANIGSNDHLVQKAR